MKKLFLLFTLCLLISTLDAQEKKVMDHDVYAIWNAVDNILITDDGKYIGFEVNPQKGDGNLIIYSVKDEVPDSIPRGYKAKAVPGSDYIAGLIKPPYQEVRKAKKEKKKQDEYPKDSIFVYRLSDMKINKFPDIRSWKTAKEKSSWIVFHQVAEKEEDKEDKEPEESEEGEQKEEKCEKKSSQENIDKKFEKIAKEYKLANLVLMNPQTGKSYRYENVASYDISDNGELVVFHQLSRDTVPVSVVYTFSTLDESLDIIYDEEGTVPALAVDNSGQQVAFLHTADSGRISGFNVFYWKTGEERADIIIDSLTNEIPQGWGVSKHGRLYFSGTGKRLFMGTAPVPPEEKEDTLLDEEKPKLDIWSYRDAYLQPQQKKMLEKEKKRTYQAYYDLERKEFIQLADTLVEDVVTMHEGNGNRMLGFVTEKYAPLLSWEGSIYRDVYLIDPENGEKELILKKKENHLHLSPFGNYVLFYEPTDSSWYSYDIREKKVVNLLKDLNTPFYYELNDVPQEPNSYGYAGFTKEDEYVLIYDRYDVWKFDPSGKEKPLNLTGGKGREKNIRYRYIKLDPEEYFIDPEEDIYLSAFNLETMEQGFAVLNSVKDPSLKSLLMASNSFYDLKKAKDEDVFMFRKGDFRNYPDIYVTDHRFRKEKRVSDVNPQSYEYLWGDVKLVEWTSYNNEELKGLLYTPENLDTTQKYPLLVYFYERSSENLYAHRIPSASRSIISIPWCTSNGYVVFVPDITYRVGYPGQSAYDAVVSGTEAMTARYGFIDKEKMGLQGQSWGGYQIAWLVTRTDMFAAAMAGAPVSNMTSAYGGIRWGSGMSRMFQYEETQSRIGATLWEEPELYLENSPVFFAPDVNTPLLMMHNDNDGAVPWYQGIEYFVALRRLGKPVWMLTYNNEEHNLTKWPNRIDLSKRMMGFFDHYLRDEPMPPWMKEGIPAIEKGKERKY